MTINKYGPMSFHSGAVQTADTDRKARDCDRLWFQQNPGRNYRIRKSLFGEQPLHPDMIGFIVVRQIFPGCRRRIGFYSSVAPVGEASEAIARGWWLALVGEKGL